MELAWERRVIRACEGSPGGAIKACIAGAALKRHAALHDAAVGQNFKPNYNGTLLVDGRVYLVGNEGVPCSLGLAVPAQEPGAEVHALRIAEDLNATAACTWVHGHLAGAAWNA